MYYTDIIFLFSGCHWPEHVFAWETNSEEHECCYWQQWIHESIETRFYIIYDVAQGNTDANKFQQYQPSQSLPGIG